MKILIVFGTRPEAIKMAMLIKEFKKNKKFKVKVCITAQHREMLDQVLDLFKIKPDFDLNIMKQNQNLYDITSNVLLKIKVVLDKFNPDCVFVHGDTTTTFIASLACFYKKIDVAHIEAGLRTFNIYSPYPEELNRQLTSKIAKWHFAPTKLAKNNLLKESVNNSNIIITGNTVIDSLLWVKDRFKDKNISNKLNNFIKKKGYEIKKNKKILLFTGHRRENFGNKFENICYALKDIADRNKDIDIVYPVHLNPNVQNPVNKILSNISNIYLLKPFGYELFVYLMNSSYLIVTDSGGIQEEAPSLEKPVIVIRDTTERTEAVKAGTVKLVGTNKDVILDTVEKLLNDSLEYQKMIKIKNPFGDGLSCQRIVDFMQKL